MSTKPRRLSAEKSKQLTRLLTISKTATLTAVMAPSELAKIIALVAKDIGKADVLAARFPDVWPHICPDGDYYSLGAEWFINTSGAVQADDLLGLLELGDSLDKDFMTYLPDVPDRIAQTQEEVRPHIGAATASNHGAGLASSIDGKWT